MASNGGFLGRRSPAKKGEAPPPQDAPPDDGDGGHSRASHRTHSSAQSERSLAVVIGKTFEATTLPDGSHRIVELTKYKRLSDGYVYQETKVRSLDDDRDDASEGREDHGRRGGGSERSLSSGNGGIVPPSSLGGRSGRLNLGRLSLGRSPKNRRPSTVKEDPYSPKAYARNGSDEFGAEVDKEEYDDAYPEVLSTFSSSGSFSVDGTNGVSVTTEDHGGYSGQPTPQQREMFMEEYLYDDDMDGFQAWRAKREGRSSHSGQRGVTPHSSTSLSSIKESIGWCAAWDENSPTSLQLARENSRLSWRWATPTRLVRSFFPSTPNERTARDVDPNCALDVNCGKRRNGGGEEDEERGIEAPSSSSGMGCKERLRTRRCKGTMVAVAAVLIGVIVAAALLAPSSQGRPSKQIDGEGADANVPPPCVHLKIVLRATETDDVNFWSLERTNPNGHVVEVASAASLPDLGEGDTHEYKKCVQPGMYNFRITDSSGDGLGSEGKGGYYITANDVTLGISSFFFHEERMTFTLPFDAEDEKDHVDSDRDTACTDDFFLAVKTDDNPSQTTWTVVDDATGKAVLEGGPYELPQTVYTRRACLPDGKYTFRMADAGADGLCCEEGKGFFVLSREGETIASSDGEFGDGRSVTFTVGGGD